MRTSALALILLALLGGGSCGPPASPAKIASVRDLGPLGFALSVRGRDGGHSARFHDRSVWAFGDTILAWPGVDGSTWRTSTVASSSDVDATDGLSGFEERVDRLMAPELFIPWTDDERAYNQARSAPACLTDCPPRWVIWPGPIVVDPATGDALVFYMKHLDWKAGGKSIARWRDLAAPVERPVVAPGTAEPTLLFPDGDVEPTSGAVGVGDTLYAYACKGQCIVGRVRFADAFTRSAWRFYAGDEGWVANFVQARWVLSSPGMLSVRYNEYLALFVALYSAGGRKVVLRTAPAPEGPWSAEVFVTEARAPEPDGPIYDALAHGELDRDAGKRIFFSHSRGTGSFASEMRLLEVTFR